MNASAPSSPVTIAVTGATGKVGGHVAELLHDLGARQRLLVRNPAKAPTWADDVAVASYGQADAAVRALEGVDLLFMVSAAESADRLEQHQTFIDAAATAGVRHVVYTSFLAAVPEATFTLARTHWATEEHLRASGMAWTFLRDSFYADFIPDLAVDGVIAGPAGSGRVGAVAREDVARSAAAILTDTAAGNDRHAGSTYDLTGPEAFTLTEAAATITAVTGRRTVYREQSLKEAYASRQVYGAPDWQVNAWVSTYTAIASGELSAVTDDVRALTGRTPLTLAEVLR
ncbi:SDR family oxidoreductase [Actinomyces ruminis]|uniref:NAD(P)-dependent oxidoreductase n=1 Tax=Actinomyces ruminis TaxID=1937003 RepID=A0ABX4M9B1_9ACTO|nr:SDR family oxidoreductase [Actinomyces ruminis]PHP52011.1 NAD(P)-dependent oxidoreductase [Actinomyces ruminis]